MSEKPTASENDTLANESHDVTQLNKRTKLAKQGGVDNEDEECSEKFITDDEAIKEAVVRHVHQVDHGNLQETVVPPHRISRTVSISTKPKVLFRSYAFSGDDDSGLPARHAPASRITTTRSKFSASFDSRHGYNYTDSTGINLLSFIACTLHKNSKDRHMLLQLEQHMTKLIKDSTRNSQKFPAMSSYNRMLVHRVAAFFGLDHNVDQNGTAVVVNKTSRTRLPDIDFLSLIQSDVYTDEPPRLLRRDAQSYEEVGQSSSGRVISRRRTRSFEVGDCLSIDPAFVTVDCTLPVTAPLHMHLVHQQGSTSSTASSTHLLESPGSCYSYGEVPVMSVYSTSERTPSFKNTTHVSPWSSSESYTSLTADHPSNIISPVIYNHPQTPVLTNRSRRASHSIACQRKREVGIDMSTSSHGTLSIRSSFPEHRLLVSRNINSDWHQREVNRSREALVSENFPPEHVHFADENGMEYGASQHQVQSAFAAPSFCADFISNQIVVNPMAEQAAFVVVPSYFCYTAPTYPIQKLTHQMGLLCATSYPERVPASPLPPAQTVYPQQYLVSPQLNSLHPPQPYFLPVFQRNYVSQYPVSNEECNNMQQGNLMDAVRTTKSGTMFEGSATITENEIVSE